jgi:WD40 repeat protein
MMTKQINFTHLSFNRAGDRFLACDLHGSIYMFDLNYNRYMRLNRLGITCTTLAYNLKCKTEYLVACIDGTIKCFNTETRDLVGWMKGHEKPIISLSVHPTNGDTVISFSADLAQLWDLKTFECKQKLNINSKKNVEILKISFAPATNDIISVFKDDSIYVWSSENISLKCQFNVNEKNDKECVPTHFYKCFSVSSDGKMLVVGSRYNYLHVFNLETKEFYKKIDLNQSETTLLTIKDCVMLPGFCYDNKYLLVLTQSGLCEIYNIETGQMMINLDSKHLVHNQSQMLNEQKPSQIYCSANARYFCAITQDGCMQIYDFDLSPVKNLKATSGMMKSSINSTNANSKNSNTTTQTKQEENKSLQIYKTNKQNVSKRTQNLLNNDQIHGKLIGILKCYNEYPARYRMFIWKMLLKLPENYESYAAFIERGTHPAYMDLNKKYPLKSQKCIRLLERTLSALGHWAPILAECDYLPLLIFPFVKLFQNNQVICFEIIATLLNNWCQHWFEFFPNPPMNILNMIENLLAYHDRVLLDHFMRFRITCQIYGWSLLETIFSEVFSKLEWQILFDNIFSNHPGFLLYLVAAYSICNRTALMQVKEIDDAKYFFRHRNPVSVSHLLNESFKMNKTTPADLDPCKLLANFEPLSKGTYPVFNKRPRFISDYQIIEKTKILQQEINYLKERETHLEAHKLVEGRKLENEYILKQMVWDANHNNKMYKESVEEYERKQRYLEQQRLKKQQENLMPSLRIDQKIPISVAGEPLVSVDKKGHTLLNKMQRIEENFEDIQNILTKARGKSDFRNENEQEDLNEESINFKDIENEIISNRAQALASAANLNEENQMGNKRNMCLNDANEKERDSVLTNCKHI